MTLLTVIQDAADLLTIPRPDAVFASTDAQITQLRGLLQATGNDLVAVHEWSSLVNQTTFTCAGTNAQTGTPPAGFDRMSDGVDIWNATRKQKIVGPVTAREWTDLITWTTSTYPQYWRLIAGVLNIYAPISGDTIRYEYVSKYWILAASGSTPTDAFTADGDTFRFPEWLLTLGVVWRWKAAKSLDDPEDVNNYNIELAARIKADQGGLRTLSTMKPEDVMPPGRRAYGSVTPLS